MEILDLKQMIEIKEKAYNNLLQQKKEIETKQKDLQEIIDLAEELEELYSEEEIKDELESKRNAIIESKKLAESFNDINSKIEGYEENHIKEQIEFLHDNYRRHDLRDNLKEIEYMTKDFEKKYGITNTVRVKNPDGKEKRIHVDFVDTYNMYLKQINELEGKKILNDYARIEGYAKAPIKSNKVTNEVENAVINDANNIEKHELEEETLSVDERINKTEVRIQEIINARYLPKHGKICVVTYNGKKIEIPKNERGNFAKLVGDLRKYNKEKSEQENIKFNEDLYKVSIDDLENIENIKPVKSEVKEEVKKQQKEEPLEIVEIKAVTKNDKKNIREKIKNIAKPVVAATIALAVFASAKLNKLKSKFASQPKNVIQQEEKEEDEIKVQNPNETIKEEKTQFEDTTNLDEKERERKRKENLAKLAQNYTMSSKALDTIENEQAYVQEGGKRR